MSRHRSFFPGVMRPLALSLLTIPVGVLAQTMVKAPEGSSVELERVVVSGEKTKRSVKDTASSVAVVTAQRVEQENISSLTEVIDRVPNMSLAYGPRTFSIRGIMNGSADPNPLVTIYLDGAPLPPAATDTLPAELWDLAQVEVFRGPQSTIQGQNALAGAIVLRTQDPTMFWDARARLTWSDPNDRRLAFAGGGPIINDELAFRVALEDRDFKGYTWNPTRNTGDDATDSQLVRAKLLWKPKSVTGLTARLSVNQDKRVGPYMFSYTETGSAGAFKNRINHSNDPNTTDGKTTASSLEVDYQLGAKWSATGLLAHSRADLTRLYDQDFTAQRLEYGSSHEVSSGSSFELRLQFQDANLRGLLGAHISDREQTGKTSSRTNVATPVATIAGVLTGSGFPAANANAIAGLYAKAMPSILVDYVSVAPSSNKNRALFVDGELKFAPQLTALAGARYDQETYSFNSDTQARFAGKLPDPASLDPTQGPISMAVGGINQAVLGLVSQAANTNPRSSHHFSAFLPKAGVRWDYAPEQSLAFTAQRAYRSGGSSFNQARAQTVVFAPEYTLNYELAFRSRAADGSFAFNANAYYIDWKDKQVNAYFGTSSFDFHTVNAGRAHLHGFELEARHRLTSALDWYAALGHSRTRYDEFKAVKGAEVDDYTGQEFAYAPRWTAALGAHYRWSNGWNLNLNANYRSSAAIEAGAGSDLVSGRTLVNAKLGYEVGQWGVYLFASNLFDRGYVQYPFRNEPRAILGAPRVLGINLTWSL